MFSSGNVLSDISGLRHSVYYSSFNPTLHIGLPLFHPFRMSVFIPQNHPAPGVAES
jgi:hypothetical protein